MSIVFTGGGTIGSITGLLSIVQELEHTQIPCYWIAPKGSQGKELIESYGVTWTEIPAGKLPRYPSLALFSALPNMIKGYTASKTLLKSFEARVVVSSGSFVSPPILKASKKLGLKNILIQLDIRMGLANKVSLASADKLFFSYPNTNKKIKNQSVVGPFIRRHVVDEAKITKVLNFTEGLPILFITGGGTGSSSINTLIWEMLPELTSVANIVHMTGEGKNKAGLTHTNYYQTQYLDADNYYHWLTRARVVVGRAGMGFFSDCIGYKKAAIVLAMPKSHQVENADYFANADAIVTPQDAGDVKSVWLLKEIKELLIDDTKRIGLEKNISRFEKEGATKKVAHAIEELHGK